jgi:mycothione reductase
VETDPRPVREFDLLVIGAGSGNSVIGPELDDWSIALVDDGQWFGGTCLNAGCIPTKMFVRVADVAADAADATRLGLSVAGVDAEWAAIRDRVFGRTDAISSAGYRYRAEDCPNITVFRSTVRFQDAHTVITSEGELLRGRKVVIAAGSRPRTLDAEVDRDPRIHDSDSIMRIDDLPRSLVIVGGGAVAVEFAHVFSSFGVDVSLINRSERLLRSQDRELSEAFTRLAAKRWRVRGGSEVRAIRAAAEGVVVEIEAGDPVTADAVLVAVGRIPNTDRLGVAAAGFDVRSDGTLAVDAAQRVLAGGSPVPGVFALGDVCNSFQLKHLANHEARLVARNLLDPAELASGYPGPVPAAIFSHPQVAHFGLTEEEATRSALEFDVTVQEYGSTAYGWALEDTSSFCKLIVGRTSGEILGAHILGPEASILIQPLIQAASDRRSIRGLARSQFWPHPAATEVVENALLSAEGKLRALGVERVEGRV